jgi:hypothetical protein
LGWLSRRWSGLCSSRFSSFFSSRFLSFHLSRLFILSVSMRDGFVWIPSNGGDDPRASDRVGGPPWRVLRVGTLCGAEEPLVEIRAGHWALRLMNRATGGAPILLLLFLLSRASRCHDRGLVYREAILPKLSRRWRVYLAFYFFAPLHAIFSFSSSYGARIQRLGIRRGIFCQVRDAIEHMRLGVPVFSTVLFLAFPFLTLFSVLDVSSFLFFGSPFSLSVFPFRPSPSPSPSESY